MRILLERVFDHWSTENTYKYIAQRLSKTGHQVTTVLSLKTSDLAPNDFDLLISHGRVPLTFRNKIACYGGLGWTRAKILELLEQHDIDTMNWTTVKSWQDLAPYFDTWGVDRILRKPSDTCGGNQIEVFTRESLNQLTDPADDDVFCAEVNPTSGDVYKVEAFNGVDTVAWRRGGAPLSTQMEGPYLKDVSTSYGNRELVEVPKELLDKIKSCSHSATSMGIGYMSFDFMKNPNGDWISIEANIERVASWWTAQIPFVRFKYANGVTQLPELE